MNRSKLSMTWSLTAFAVVVSLVRPAAAEAPLLTASELESQATLAITGRVLAIYSRRVSRPAGGAQTHYLLEIDVTSCEKGGDVRPGELAYVRCWHVTEPDPHPQPGTNGHVIPREGAVIRAFLVGSEQPGASRPRRGWDALLPNGLIEVEPPRP
ncbi:hypothetical protein [Lacipirellula limnantheis]|uniref:Uncharacterized protein n=1 Tax=Lacipirellula limnantheis TaxID=2528024 RepID=A0A517TYG2_9BACT|nr:hypothetical protein [Lacipirellula limnantheis]QDT73414.1 hypothetical protein I41_26030 [Lacipirellula limnantheis]